jgi:predicted nucleic acid-binding Zn ribbon protein
MVIFYNAMFVDKKCIAYEAHCASCGKPISSDELTEDEKKQIATPEVER